MMNVDATKLLDAAAALNELSQTASGMHPEHPLASEAAHMRLALTLAALYVADFAKHAAAGKTADEALIATLEGASPVSTEQQQGLKDAQRLSRH